MSAVMLVVVLLIPGTLPRYVLPLGVPLVLGTALLVPPEPLYQWVRRYVAALVVLSAVFALVIAPRMNRRDDLRPLAKAVDAAVPPGTTLIVYDPGYQAGLFYVRTPLRYVDEMEDLPERGAWVLAKAKDRGKLERKRPDLVEKDVFLRRDTPEMILLHSRED
jgi:hypothetical protein